MTTVSLQIACMAIALSVSSAGESLFPLWHPDDRSVAEAWEGGPLQIEAEDGELYYVLTKVPNNVRTKQPIPIERDKTYEISGWFRSGDPDFLARVLLDVVFLDQDGAAIDPRSVWPITGESRLAADLAADSTEVRVVASDWELPERGAVLVFDAAEDQSDLPNTSYVQVREVTTVDGIYHITLARPAETAYPAGTMVRIHRYLDYPRTSEDHIPTEWTRYSFRIAAEPPQGSRNNNYFWPGAESMRIIVRNNPRRRETRPEVQVLNFKDVRIAEVGD